LREESVEQAHYPRQRLTMPKRSTRDLPVCPASTRRVPHGPQGPGERNDARRDEFMAHVYALRRKGPSGRFIGLPMGRATAPVGADIHAGRRGAVWNEWKCET
jgi:hypothetical protein